MRNTILIVCCALLLISCGGKKNNPTPPAPSVATLSSPAQNSICTTGTVINTTQSAVAFSWNQAANANSYDLTVTNLLTAATTTQTFTTNQATLTLLRNAPYSWYVTSKSNSSTTTARSDAWKFYNAGAGIVTYAPFPASITSPAFAQAVTANAGTINLSWSGSTVEPNALLVFDVYLGTTTSPSLLKSNVADSFLNNVQVVSKTTYYWKVISKDAAGNSSDSGLHQFGVN